MKLHLPRLHKEERNNILLFLACMFVHVMTGFAKSNYGATIAYIVREGIFDKPASGMIASAFYVFYGIGQMVGGKLVDKFSPYKCIAIGVLGALLCNLILVFTMNYTVVLIVWSINGFLQFGIWPGISRIIATDVFPVFRQKAGFHLSYGLTLGNIFSFLCAALLLDLFGWSVMFGSSAVMLLAALIIWLLASRLKPAEAERDVPVVVEKKKEESNEPKPGLWKVFNASGFTITLPVAILACMLSNGTQVWIPTMIMESYTVSQSWANVQSIILSIVGVLALWSVMPLFKKMKDEMMARVLFYALALIPLIVLQFIGKVPMVLAVVMLAMFQSVIGFSGAFTNSIFSRFAPYGYSGTAAGISNSMSSFGIVIASTLYGLIAASSWGWSGVAAVWLILTVLIVIGYLITSVLWKKYFKIGKKYEA